MADDKSGMVANACRTSFDPPTSSLPSLVFVVPDGKSAPLPLASYSLLRADGLIRSGNADRREPLIHVKRNGERPPASRG